MNSVSPSFLQIHVAAVRQHPQHAAGPQSGVAHDRQGEEAVSGGGCFQEEDDHCFIDFFFTQLSLLKHVHPSLNFGLIYGLKFKFPEIFIFLDTFINAKQTDRQESAVIIQAIHLLI